MDNLIIERIQSSIDAKQQLLSDRLFIESVAELSKAIIHCIQSGHRLLICGNGGSASDALHFAAEIVGRFQKERSPWPAIVLNSDVAIMTAIANDYGYENVYARQVAAQAKVGDLFLGISTSGNSANVIHAATEAKKLGIATAALLGRDGGKIKTLVDYPVVVSNDITARIQECHIMIIHILCELVEKELQ